jgi:type I restriction enzyme, S subunit
LKGYPRTPIKHLATVVGRIGWHGLTTSDYDTVGEYLVTGTDIIEGVVAWDHCHRVSTEIYERDPRIQLSEGDLLVTKDGTIGKIAQVAQMPGRATLNSGIFRISPRRRVLDSRFGFWALSSRLFTDFVELLSSGSTINHLYQADIVEFGLPLPPLTIQRALAVLLDQETAQIDALIASKQRLLELISEKESQLFMSTMASRGFVFPRQLDPNWPEAKLPYGWRVVRLSQCLRQLTNGYVGPTRDILRDEGVRYIQSLHIKNGLIDFTRGPFFVDEAWHRDHPRIHLAPGDVLIVQTGDIGQVAVVPDGFGDASCHALQIARVRADFLSGEFLGAYLRSPFGYQSLLSRATGALHPHLEGGIRDVPIVLPPLAAQADILSEVAAFRAPLIRLREGLSRQIQLVCERRQALITATVSGPVENTGAAA